MRELFEGNGENIKTDFKLEDIPAIWTKKKKVVIRLEELARIWRNFETGEKQTGVSQFFTEAQELKVLLENVANKMTKLSKISYEIYFLIKLIEEIYAKIIEAREVAKRIERMMEESRSEER